MIKFPPHIILFLCVVGTLLVWPSSSSSSGLPSLAKPGCLSLCGKVHIPYPFGIGPGCSLDKWFRIFCRNSTPYLRLINNTQELEVLQIEVEKDPKTVKVNHPITFLNCGTAKRFQPSANLTASPFVFSQKANRFTGVSCDVLSLMKSNDTDQARTIAACMSICDEASSETSCNGMNCCQTAIPSDLRIFQPDFKTERTNRAGMNCSYAFLVESAWFHQNMMTRRSRRFDAVKEEIEYVPVVLEWSLFNWTVGEFGGAINRTRRPRMNITNNAFCEIDGKVRSPVDNKERLLCSCRLGFEGNPYLLDCREKDECSQSDLNYCGPEGYCSKISGRYVCSYLLPDKKPTSNKVVLGLGLGFGALFLIITSWCLHKVIKRRKRIRRKEKFFKRNGGLLLQQQMFSNNANVDNTKLFTSKELKKATDNFNVDRILGQGGQGTVYKGMLADGRIVAVKKSKILDEGKVVEFVNEVVILSQINHRNVVKLLGCCLETEVPLLVYEFIPNGTLSEYIHNENEEFPFKWEMRLRVAKEIAGALFYLHYAASFPIFHRDIKSTNVLLDEKYRAKIADFGTSKSLNIDQTHVTTQVHGTFGYLDPEYFQSNQFTEKSDVYSFGVLLVELLTGQKAISMKRSQEGRSLATYFIVSMKENRLSDILDAKVMEGSKEEIMVVANIANRCLHLNGKNRPTMKEVTVELEGIQLSEKASNDRQHYDEVEYVRSEPIEPWDVVSTSIGSAFDTSTSSGDRRASSLVHEFPLLSFKSR